MINESSIDFTRSTIDFNARLGVVLVHNPHALPSPFFLS